MTLYILCGIPGCGKTTWAHEHHPEAVIVSTDKIRGELYGDERVQGEGLDVFAIAHRRVRAALKQGSDVVFDATNIRKKDRELLKSRVADLHPRIVAVAFKTLVKDCMKRNEERNRVVPESVIWRMAKHYTYPMPEDFDEVITVG